MARIRTIKPEFFTSDDICALSPLARLLYIGLWCEADREGRLMWAPRGFKRRFLPDDDCDIDALCRELTDRTLVRLYGDGLAFIPTFSTHQHVNPREAASKLAPPPTSPHAPPPVGDASPSVADAQGGRELKEGKGREGEGRRAPSAAHTLPEGWTPAEDDIRWVGKARPDLTAAMVEAETERFRNFQAAQNRTAHSWGPLWRNWVMKAASAELLARRGPAAAAAGQAREPLRLTGAHSVWTFRLMAHRPGAPWPEEHGPAPESDLDNPKLDDGQRRQWRRHHGLPAAWQKVPM
ncbi:hypothetical protein [Reyranella sp.]|uniref:hypothetical protein n=1 Tax=Reyranella sp. TaxID=1929291 RepID=UPI003D12849F